MSNYRLAIREKTAAKLNRSFVVGQKVKPRCPYSPLNHPEAKIVVRSVKSQELIVEGYYAAGFTVLFPIKPESLIAA